MTRGIIDLKIVNDRLDMVRSAIAELRGLPHTSLDVFTGDRRNIWSADALLRRAIEALFDAARHLLAKAYGRGGLEYREVARLALEHGLLSPEFAARFVRIAGFRNRLTHHYDAVTPEELFAVLEQHLGDVSALADQFEAAAARLAASIDPPPGAPTP
ncbi:MAG: HepT-like ribonuclease domain-containing protein [Acidobacteriota bacterium]